VAMHIAHYVRMRMQEGKTEVGEKIEDHVAQVREGLAGHDSARPGEATPVKPKAVHVGLNKYRHEHVATNLESEIEME
jgi:hypothetical protein